MDHVQGLISQLEGELGKDWVTQFKAELNTTVTGIENRIKGALDELAKKGPKHNKRKSSSTLEG